MTTSVPGRRDRLSLGSLEPRLAHAVVINDAAAFSIVLTAADTVAVGVNAAGKVTVASNGGVAVAQATSAAAVTSLTVTGLGTFDNAIDLRAVVPSAFPLLAQLDVDAAFGTDTLVGPNDTRPQYVSTPIAFENIDLAAGAPGVFVVGDNADDAFGNVDLGANTFNFYGVTYTGANHSSPVRMG